MRKNIVLVFLICILAQVVIAETKSDKFDFTGPRDASQIRGFNYTPSNVKAPRHHTDSWVKYDSARTAFELDLAKSLDMNLARVFIMYNVYQEDKEAFPSKLQHFVRECHKRGIGVVPVVGYGPWMRDLENMPGAREWAQYLVDAIGNEPGLAMWDVMNEPDWPPDVEEWVKSKSETAKFLSKTFKELNPETPITIGCAFVDAMIELEPYVDVLQFHDYMQTREQIRNNIKRAKAFAAEVNKPVFNGEMGCIARANPYDITLQEHMDANMGWCIWELMIVNEGWGTVHGVFYGDGAVRDPSIPAAMMGFFRKRSGEILPAVTDQEGWITKILDRANVWLQDPEATWEDGLDIAETSAHLLEAGELVAMRIPPTYEVAALRAGEQNIKALSVLIAKFKRQLEPYKLPQEDETE